MAPGPDRVKAANALLAQEKAVRLVRNGDVRALCATYGAMQTAALCDMRYSTIRAIQGPAS